MVDPELGLLVVEHLLLLVELPLERIAGGLALVDLAHGLLEVHVADPGVGGTGGLGRIPGSGKFQPPSITVYEKDASGDVAPLRVISGPKTMMNWPTAIAVHPDLGEIFVANDTADLITVYKITDNGDVAPTRTIKGPRTGVKNPTGVYVDSKNKEVWVSNMGNHRATVYPIDADGDTPPLRTIRSAPNDKLAMAIGNPGAVGFDTKREEILVPN